jgi:hypothetical protein
VPQHGESRLAVELARLAASAAVSSISLSRLTMSQIVRSIALNGTRHGTCAPDSSPVSGSRHAVVHYGLGGYETRHELGSSRHLMPISDDLWYIFSQVVTL